jgi:hypothetical protein
LRYPEKWFRGLRGLFRRTAGDETLPPGTAPDVLFILAHDGNNAAEALIAAIRSLFSSMAPP